MQLIAEKAADTPTHLFLDVGTQRIPTLRSPDRIEAVRVLCNFCQLVYYAFAFGAPQMCGSSIAVDPAVLSNLDPLDPFSRIDRRPQDGPTVGADMVFLVLILEEKLVGRYRITNLDIRISIPDSRYWITNISHAHKAWLICFYFFRIRHFCTPSFVFTFSFSVSFRLLTIY